MKFSNLFTPLKVGRHLYKNRIVASPMYNGQFVTIPSLSRVFLESMEEKARGGCAEVAVGETAVDFEYANRETFEPIDYTKHEGPTFEAFKKVASLIKKHGAKALIELDHCGESKLFVPGLKNPIGPMGYLREDGVEVKAMDEAMMRAVCNNFVTSSRFMKAAGFDGVVIHAGHGWLMHQFLSARTNRRTDKYGGSLKNRARFPLQIIKRVREAMGKDFIIEVRVSGEERIENGMGIAETVDFCKMIEKYVDMIHVSSGIYRSPVLSGMISSSFAPHALNADDAEAVKKAVSVPVAVVGGINSPELAEKLIAEGKCDLVALGRQTTADPDFANKAQAGNEEDITPCTRCFKCFLGPLEEVLPRLGSLMACTVNPKHNYLNKELLESTPKASRTVLVIGGGVAGMEAAIVAADRGHKVTLVEKSHTLGGLLNLATEDFYKADLRVFKDLLVRRIHKRDINLMLDKELTPEEVRSFGADAIIVAVGARPVVPLIPGIESALKAVDIYKDISKVGQKIIMVGGGQVGCELGLHLAKNGREVTIVEMTDNIAPDAYPFYRMALLNEMDKVLVYKTGLKCTSIAPNGITVVNSKNQEEFLLGDTVVYAVGMQPNREVVEKIRNAAGDVPVYEAGDCTRPATVCEAARAGFEAGLSIL
jgi:2,4-dienoyl-CoA reductase-like NADH-dependent reductase (Old Yellow Enzyme family)/NADPH-dependent 2,4-dienoyl-CoA reductase/sulfur reductase-like enzyme